LLTDKQTNNDENITSFAEVIRSKITWHTTGETYHCSAALPACSFEV